ncbi:hypothetical protein ACHAXT_004482 [Thalassiosira profunda]
MPPALRSPIDEDGNVSLVVTGLPAGATESTVKDFFRGKEYHGVEVDLDDANRCVVHLPALAAVNACVEMHGEDMGGSQLDVQFEAVTMEADGSWSVGAFNNKGVRFTIKVTHRFEDEQGKMKSKMKALSIGRDWEQMPGDDACKAQGSIIILIARHGNLAAWKASDHKTWAATLDAHDHDFYHVIAADSGGTWANKRKLYLAQQTGGELDLHQIITDARAVPNATTLGGGDDEMSTAIMTKSHLEFDQFFNEKMGAIMEESMKSLSISSDRAEIDAAAGERLKGVLGVGANLPSVDRGVSNEFNRGNDAAIAGSSCLCLIPFLEGWSYKSRAVAKVMARVVAGSFDWDQEIMAGMIRSILEDGTRGRLWLFEEVKGAGHQYTANVIAFEDIESKCDTRSAAESSPFHQMYKILRAAKGKKKKHADSDSDSDSDSEEFELGSEEKDDEEE